MVKKRKNSPWVLGGALLLSITWLVPVHYSPYLAFHSDAWAATVLAMVSALLALLSLRAIAWHSLSALIAVMAIIPLVQHLLGLIFFRGTAWINFVYIVGLLVALLVGGSANERVQSRLVDLIFLATGIASIVSVGIQLTQWLGGSVQDQISNIWILPLHGARPYGNLGQPNQLASLLLLGVLAGGWGVLRRAIRVSVAVFYGGFVLFGVALTQSRTAWLAVLMLVAAAWFWRKCWSSRMVPWVISLFGAYFFLIVVGLGLLNRWLDQGVVVDLSDRVVANFPVRPAVWSLYLDAMGSRPWFGYGWGQLLPAQISRIMDYPAVHGLLHQHSHNLFLDLIVWNGFPIGIIVSFCLIAWAVRAIIAVGRQDAAIVLLAVLVIGLHAMLEFPLHYAYFLLPIGFFVGVLNARLGFRVLFYGGRLVLVLIITIGSVLTGLIVVDYQRIQSAYFNLRLERNLGGESVVNEELNVSLLTQLSEHIKYSRFEPDDGMSEAQISWARKVTSLFPSTADLLKFVRILVLNNQLEEANLWLHRICPIVSASQCVAAEHAWKRAQQEDSRLRTLPWPEGCLRGRCREVVDRFS